MALSEEDDWSDKRAGCYDNGELWFSRDRHDRRMALIICSRCPIRKTCLENTMIFEAIKPSDLRVGIAGGLTPYQRRLVYKESLEQQLSEKEQLCLTQLRFQLSLWDRQS